MDMDRVSRTSKKNLGIIDASNRDSLENIRSEFRDTLEDYRSNITVQMHCTNLEEKICRKTRDSLQKFRPRGVYSIVISTRSYRRDQISYSR